MFSQVFTYLLALALALRSTVAAPSGTIRPGADRLAACAALMNDALPSPTPPGFVFSGNVRQYYVAAEEVEWDYAPTGWDNWLGVPLDISPRAKAAGITTYGTTWLKALYRGYTDATFTKYSAQPPWQGTLGPTLRSEVGDLVSILFVNKLSKNYATMHSMGLGYTKYNEGSDYPNNTAPGVNVVLPEAEAVPPVPPGECVVYKWFVGEIDGPPAGEVASVHSYHSYVSLKQDLDSGLMGPHFVYAPGQMASTIANYREFPLLYYIYSENDSWLSNQNKVRLTSRNSTLGRLPTENLESGNRTVWHPQLVNLGDSGHFAGAPSFYTMNGYTFGNNPTFEMCLSDKIIWYTMAYGSASHVFHMHGNNFYYNGVGTVSISLNDGEQKPLYMNATGAGKWQVLCHVSDHQDSGMESYYQVYFAGHCPLNPLGS